MKTTVINIRNAPIGWQTNSQYVYIGRAGKGQDGYFGNPIAKGQPCRQCGQVHTLAGDTLICYRKDLDSRLENPEFSRRVKALYGKTLVCFCKPLPCHGDILAKVCEELNTEVL